MKKLLVMLVSIWGLAGAPVAAAAPPYTVSGTVVDADTDRAVKWAIVLVIDYDTGEVDAAITDRNGDFTVTGIDGEEFSIVVIGSSRYESGYVTCPDPVTGDFGVVPTFGEACTLGPSALTGDILLERR